MPLLALALGGLTTSCGSSSLSGLVVGAEVISQGTPATSAPVPQGTSAELQVTVTNVSSSSLRGVTIRVQVPSGFTYTNTISVVENGDSVRSSDIAPTSRDATLTWGAWTIGPGGPSQPSQVQITANLMATGGGGTAQLAPQVFATGYNTYLTGKPVTLQITPAPSLALVLHVSPASVAAGGELTYRATITNTGSGAAPGTALGITLPSDFDYVTTLSTSGNASTGGATYPIAGSVIPTWSGFDIPGQGSGGPGLLALTFQVKVLTDVGPGMYGATASLVAGNGSSTSNDMQLNYQGLAPVQVTSPAPSSSAG